MKASPKWSQAGLAGRGIRAKLVDVRTCVFKVETGHTARSLAGQVRPCGGLALLESSLRTPGGGRYSLVAAAPQLTLRSVGARCELFTGDRLRVQFGNPWRILDELLRRYDLPAEQDLPLPAGACIGFWGYELRQFIEPKLRPHPAGDLPFPDCWLGFYDSLVVFDHGRGEAWVLSTGLQPDGSCSGRKARERADFWRRELEAPPSEGKARPGGVPALPAGPWSVWQDRPGVLAAARPRPGSGRR